MGKAEKNGQMLWLYAHLGDPEETPGPTLAIVVSQDMNKLVENLSLPLCSSLQIKKIL